MKAFKLFSLSLILLALVSCENSGPKFSKIIVVNNSQETLLNTTNRKELKEIQSIFYAKEESLDAGPNYRFRLEITTKEGTVRWQYSLSGFLVSFNGDRKIYRVKKVARFNRLLNIKEI